MLNRNPWKFKKIVWKEGKPFAEMREDALGGVPGLYDKSGCERELEIWDTILRQKCFGDKRSLKKVDKSINALKTAMHEIYLVEHMSK